MSVDSLVWELSRGSGWKLRAACRPSRLPAGVSSLMFVPTALDSHSPTAWANKSVPVALGICAGCEVKAACAAFAEEQHITFGVWGGRLLGRGPDRHHNRGLRNRAFSGSVR